jgi:predicted Fe-Mo cluster-binding NifX family protein
VKPEEKVAREAMMGTYKENLRMKIAVPTNDGISISEHFGRSAAFVVFDVDDGKIQNRESRTNGMKHTHARGTCDHHAGENQPHSHAGILASLKGCEIVICSGMGQRAATALQESGIQIVLAAPGSAEEAVAHFLAGTLRTAEGSFCQCRH